jgi:hypothetical protein
MDVRTLYFIAMLMLVWLFCVVCWVATWPITMILKVLLLAVGALLFSGARVPEIHKRPILNSSDSLL